MSPTPEVRHSPLALWHLLSLDAPTVATLWTWFVARCCGLDLPFTSLASMFIAVWMLYAADRLLDARALESHDVATSANSPLEARHRFHQQHRRAFLLVSVAGAISLAALLPTLPLEALRLYAMLGGLLFTWFLLIHTRLAVDRRLPKELAVGVFFPAAVFIPTVARRPDFRLPLLLPAVFFAAACTLNCLYLYAWEHPADQSQAHWTTKFATRRLTAAASLLSVMSFLYMMAPTHSRAFSGAVLPNLLPQAATYLPAATLTSAILLMLLHRFRAGLSAIHLRAAADVALLTPLLFAPMLILRR